MEKLLPDQLKSLWQSVEMKRLSPEEFEVEQERLTNEYKQLWTPALSLEGQPDLTASLLAETGRYVGCDDLAEIERRCRHGVLAVKQEWETTFHAGDLQTAEKF